VQRKLIHQLINVYDCFEYRYLVKKVPYCSLNKSLISFNGLFIAHSMYCIPQTVFRAAMGFPQEEVIVTTNPVE
jgi:hypothetical protein